jgi:hypothetical protein
MPKAHGDLCLGVNGGRWQERDRRGLPFALVAARRGVCRPNAIPAEATASRSARVGLAFSLGFMLTSLLAIWLFQEFVVSKMLVPAREIPYSEFRDALKSGQLVEITIGGPRITGLMKNPAATSERESESPITLGQDPADGMGVEDAFGVRATGAAFAVSSLDEAPSEVGAVKA